MCQILGIKGNWKDEMVRKVTDEKRPNKDDNSRTLKGTSDGYNLNSI